MLRSRRRLSKALATLFLLAGFARAADPPPDLEKLRKVAAAPEASKEKVSALVELSRAAWQTDLPTARRQADAAREMATRLGDRTGLAKSLHSLGTIDLLEGNYESSRAFLERSARQAIANGDRKSAGRSTTNAGHALRALGRYDEALAAYDKAFRLAESAGDVEGLASARDGVGNVHSEQGRYEPAIAAFRESMEWAGKAGDDASRVSTLNNIANCRQNQGDLPAALAGYMEAAAGFERLGKPAYQAQAYGNIASVLISQNIFDQARDYLDRALTIQRANGQKGAEASTLVTLGVLYGQMNRRDDAEKTYEKALDAFRVAGDRGGEALALHNLGLSYGERKDFPRARGALEASLAIRKEIGDQRGEAYSKVSLGEAFVTSGRPTEALSILRDGLAQAIDLGAGDVELEAHRSLARALEAAGRPAEALAELQSSVTLGEKLLNDSSQEKIAEMQTRFETERKEKEIRVLERDHQIQELRLNREVVLRRGLVGAVVLALALALALASRYQVKRAAEIALTEKNHQLEIARAAIEVERDKSEQLLLNILPPAIAGRLKDHEGIIADRFSEATILFADIVGFTRLSHELGAETLVRMLNEIFTRFDALTERHGLEKIKTIGDCYMVVGGVPNAHPNPCAAVARMGLDMIRELDAFNAHRGRNLAVRIGVNTGVVVAGVIGRKKFIYDLWGDAVNVASRMESQGEPSRIQVTDSVHRHLSGDFLFEPRGEIEVKGKGPMKTWFLLGENPA